MNIGHEEAIHLLHVYSHDAAARRQFHYNEGEPVVYPPLPHIAGLHRDDSNRPEHGNDVWKFGCGFDAQEFVKALDAYWEALGLRDHVRIFARTGEAKSYMA
jgi:hypothetical protein